MNYLPSIQVSIAGETDFTYYQFCDAIFETQHIRRLVMAPDHFPSVLKPSCCWSDLQVDFEAVRQIPRTLGIS